MSKDFPIAPPTIPLILQELETDGTAHIGFANDKGWVYIKDSCGDQLRYLARDVREASEIKIWHAECAEAMIHE